MQVSQSAVEQFVQDPENAERVREGQEFFQKVLSRSAYDPEFRQQLVEEPKATIISFFNETHDQQMQDADMPWDLNFIEPEGDMMYVLPAIHDPQAELSEAELEVVAGGLSPALWAGFALGSLTVGGIYAGVKWIGSKFDDPAPVCTAQ